MSVENLIREYIWWIKIKIDTVELELNLCTFVLDEIGGYLFAMNMKYSNNPNLFFYDIFKSAVT